MPNIEGSIASVYMDRENPAPTSSGMIKFKTQTQAWFSVEGGGVVKGLTWNIVSIDAAAENSIYNTYLTNDVKVKAIVILRYIRIF